VNEWLCPFVRPEHMKSMIVCKCFYYWVNRTKSLFRVMRMPRSTVLAAFTYSLSAIIVVRSWELSMLTRTIPIPIALLFLLLAQKKGAKKKAGKSKCSAAFAGPTHTKGMLICNCFLILKWKDETFVSCYAGCLVALFRRLAVI
jgi:hypothetical protein